MNFRNPLFILFVVIFIISSHRLSGQLDRNDFKERDYYGLHVKNNHTIYKISANALQFMKQNNIEIDFDNRKLKYKNGEIFFSPSVKAVGLCRYSPNSLLMIVFSPSHGTAYPKDQYIITTDNAAKYNVGDNYFTGNLYRFLNDFIIDSYYYKRKDIDIAPLLVDEKETEEISDFGKFVNDEKFDDDDEKFDDDDEKFDDDDEKFDDDDEKFDDDDENNDE